MRYINTYAHIKSIYRSKIISNEILYFAKKTFEEEIKNMRFEGIIILEKGDLLLGLNLFGLNIKTSGIIGIQPIKVIIESNLIYCKYCYDNKEIHLIFEKHICNEEIYKWFLLQSEFIEVKQ